MSEVDQNGSSRRTFLKNTGTAAAVSALSGVAIPRVHAQTDSTVRLALIGCGGRGTGAAANALETSQGPVQLVAMADVFESRMNSSFNRLKKFDEKVDVPPERKFIGFDGYKKAMDCLKPGDVAIFTTPLAFRWVHFGYAVEKGLNVFMEKPLSADGPCSRRLLELAKKADEKNLKVGVGLMSRHQRGLQELANRIHDGEIGDLTLLRAYRMTGPVGSAFSKRWPGGDTSELMWQIQRFHSFLWASGGCFSDFMIHVIDHSCWMKNAWPVKASGIGGRHFRDDHVDQNFDSYSVEYTFADGTKLLTGGRCMTGASHIYNSYAHGTKGSAIISRSGDCGGPSSIYSTQQPDQSKKLWQSVIPQGETSPYLNEWNDLMKAIRNDEHFNEAERGVMASLTTSLGRRAAHCAQEVTFDEMLNAEEEYAPGCDQWTLDSPPPIVGDAEGQYPIPRPGKIKKLEYKMPAPPPPPPPPEPVKPVE